MESAERSAPRRHLHGILVAVGLAVTIVFGYLAVRNAQLSEVWDGLKEMNAWWLVPAFLLLALCVFLRACLLYTSPSPRDS